MDRNLFAKLGVMLSSIFLAMISSFVISKTLKSMQWYICILWLLI